MNDVSDLKYSDNAAITRYYFQKELYDISFFVEDTDKEYEYEEIFERILPIEIKRGIFSLGGKSNLENAFYIVNNKIGKVFFIADGDFDIILGRKQIQADNFLYLKKYNIESYLLYKPAIISYMRPRLKIPKSETEQVIDYDAWEQTVTPFFKKIFALHSLIQKNELQIKNVSRGAAFFVNKNGMPNEQNYDKYLDEIKTIIPNVEDEIQGRTIDLEYTYGSEATCFVSGKYFIESLSRYLNSKPVNKKQNYDDLKAFLIANFDITQLDYLVKKIKSYIK